MKLVVEVLLLSVQVAGVATLLASPVAIALGYLLSRRQFMAKPLVSALVGLPLVLPPTAIGYLLLRLLSADGWLGGLDILLTWKAAVLAAAVMAFPLIARTARVAFDGVDPELERMASTLGYSRLRALASVTLPLATRGLVAGLILGFTRAVGEFGATVIIAGNIPGRTQTLASAIFSAQQVGDERAAFWLMAAAIGVGIFAMASAEWLTRGRG